EEKPHLHGTGMAGAIVAHQNMLGVAPGAALLAVSAFSTKAATAEGTTFNILKGLDWAAAQGARVINMSFAGPADPLLRDTLLQRNPSLTPAEVRKILVDTAKHLGKPRDRDFGAGLVDAFKAVLAAKPSS